MLNYKTIDLKVKFSYVITMKKFYKDVHMSIFSKMILHVCHNENTFCALFFPESAI